MRLRQLAITTILACAPIVPAWAAVVGTLDAVGDQIIAPVAFNATVFNSFSDVPGGLQFAVAPGLQGPVKLELVQSTANVKVAAAAIGGAFGITQSLPLVLTSVETFTSGVHPFAIGAVTTGAKEGALIARLTLTPIPASGLLLAPLLAGIALMSARRKG